MPTWSVAAGSAPLVYAAFAHLLGVWFASFGMKAEYTAAEWAFTGVIGAAAVLIGALVAKPFAV